eukprot:6191449-Pleurochrysis_carterae.AAC.1
MRLLAASARICSYAYAEADSILRIESASASVLSCSHTRARSVSPHVDAHSGRHGVAAIWRGEQRGRAGAREKRRWESEASWRAIERERAWERRSSTH